MPDSYSSHPLENKVKSQFSASTRQFFQSKSSLDQFLTQFFLPKRFDYDQNALIFYSSANNLTHKLHLISNRQGQNLYTSLFYKSNLDQLPTTCIIYCHGFGSTRLQSCNIMKVLPQSIALCCFDFSGSGKSQGQIATYGAKQKQDIYSVIEYLKVQFNFKRFVLWGRSMGATACLLYSLKYQKGRAVESQGVLFQVVDSPFLSFQKIAVEMARKFVSMPEFGTNIVLDMMKRNCACLKQYNPFSVDLQKISECKIPTLFIYSETDEIVSSKNSEQLCQRFKYFYQKIIITQKHNTPRPTQILTQIIKKIQFQLKKCQITNKKGFTFRSFISSESNKSKSSRKGIQRSSLRQNVKIGKCSGNVTTNKQTQQSQYGLGVSVKCKMLSPHRSAFPGNMYCGNLGQNSTVKPVGLYIYPHQYDLTQNPPNSINTSQINHTQSAMTNNLAALHENYGSIYQMNKPQLITNKKNLKVFSSPLNSRNVLNPLTIFKREQINRISQKQNSHRCSESTPKKLNISLSKIKIMKQGYKKVNFNQNHLIKIKQKGKQQDRNNFNSIRNQFYNLRAAIRPLSSPKEFSCPKSPYKLTNITRNYSLSLSMDNLHFLGANKHSPKPSNNFQRRGAIFDKQTKNTNPQPNTQRATKNIKSSQIIYYNKNSYRYGI